MNQESTSFSKIDELLINVYITVCKNCEISYATNIKKWRNNIEIKSKKMHFMYLLNLLKGKRILMLYCLFNKTNIINVNCS